MCCPDGIAAWRAFGCQAVLDRAAGCFQASPQQRVLVACLFHAFQPVMLACIKATMLTSQTGGGFSSSPSVIYLVLLHLLRKHDCNAHLWLRMSVQLTNTVKVVVYTDIMWGQCMKGCCGKSGDVSGMWISRQGVLLQES